LVSFVGYCRAASSAGSVQQLHLDHYPGFTESVIERLTAAVKDRHGLDDILVIHRVGDIPAGEAIVLVAAQSSHRAAAIAAIAELMDYLKTDAPLWKREITASGSQWIEPTDADHAHRRTHEGTGHD
jgi:molybdopterin synthase catalytic subunit